MVETFELEGISFNASHFSTFTKEKFVKRLLKEGLFSNYGKTNQKKLINDAWVGIKAVTANGRT